MIPPVRVVRACLWRALVAAGVVGALAGALACASDTAAPPLQPADQLYWQLTLNHHAITLATVAPYNTIQLIATPRTVIGTPLTASASPTYTTSDTSITVDSTGLVKVHGTKTKTNITVIAKLTVGDAQKITLVDTAFVNVVQPPVGGTVPTLDSLLLRPAAGDSAVRSVLLATGAAGTQTFATPVAKTAQGDSIPNVAVRYSSSNPLIAKFATPTKGTVTAVSTGVVLLMAEATVYGKSVTDTLRYTVGWPLMNMVSYGVALTSTLPIFALEPEPQPNVFQSGEHVVVGQGGVVVWQNQTWGLVDDSLDVQFADTNGVVGLNTTLSFLSPTCVNLQPDVGGNIPAFAGLSFQASATICPLFSFKNVYAATQRARVFPQVGTYTWQSLKQQITGQIVVKSNASVQ